MQLIIIICSFFWGEKQFGPPNVVPLIYILFTVIGLSPYGGILVFGLNFIIFISSYQGSSIFSHPTFYYIAGMALYQIGLIISIKRPKDKPLIKKDPAKFGYNDHFQYLIVHEEVSNACSGMTKTTWNAQTKSFTWNIVRPQSGFEKFSTDCLYCGKTLQLVNVLSVEEIAAQKKSSKNALKISAILLPVFILCFILPLFFTLPQWFDYLLIVFLVGSGVSLIGFFVSLSTLASIRLQNFGSGSAMGELKNEHMVGPYNQHYIKEIEGWQQDL